MLAVNVKTFPDAQLLSEVPPIVNKIQASAVFNLDLVKHVLHILDIQVSKSTTHCPGPFY